MLRRLLTLLAILSGLAVAGTPAQAHVAEQASVRLVATAELASKCSSASSGVAFVEARSATRDSEKAPCPKPKPSVVLPPVMVGPDRALE
jgi:hypothetical protein